MSATERRRSNGGIDPGQLAVGAGLGLLLLLGAGLWVAVHLGRLFDPAQSPLPTENPVALPIYLVRGMVPMTAADLVCLGLVGVLAGAVCALAARAVLRRRKPNRHVDKAAPHMARGRELDRYTRAAAAAVAARLGAATGIPGVFLGHTVAGRRELWADWESTEVDIWGPRTGKTTSRAIPALLDAPGAAIATTNRRDLVDATRDVRAARGTVWVFDPQDIVSELPSFFWNPLTYITSGPADPVVKAQQLAGIFAASIAPPDSKADRFFDPKGQALLGHLLLAAAVSGRSMADVYRWVNREIDTEPARLLDATYRASADFVRGIIGSPDKQRGGIYATAELCITWMTNPSAVRWLSGGSGRTEFAPGRFAHSTDTLYLVSREGRGTLGPLTAALTAAVCEAAEHVATRSPHGRLPVPLVAVLDEAANVCRWPELPDLFSHYGGRGIYLLVILQSWRQGEDAWGHRGMAKMWSAATVRIYGGGDTEVPFLDELRRLIGQYRPQSTSATSSRSGRSVNYSEERDDVLDVADLSALQRGRAVLIGSGARPVLIAPRPWSMGPHRAAVEASRAAHDPAAQPARPVLNPEPDVPPAGALFRGRTS